MTEEEKIEEARKKGYEEGHKDGYAEGYEKGCKVGIVTYENKSLNDANDNTIQKPEDK